VISHRKGGKMSNNDNPLAGTQERKVEVVRVGGRIAQTGVVKRTSYEENMTPEGVLERITTTEFGEPDCHHVGVDIGGQCLCGLLWCKACAEKHGTCEVCGELLCPNCGETAFFDKSKKRHKACFWEAVRRKIFGGIQ
jgi:hypothetical protein